MQELREEILHHELFGGAIGLSFPNRLVDISGFRPVPDHQEVFADGAQDQSLIVEILQYQSHVADDAVAAHLFKDLADQNDAYESTYDGALPVEDRFRPNIKDAAAVQMGTGRQTAGKGRQHNLDAANEIQVVLAVIRLPQHTTDILVSLNSPITIANASAAAADADAGAKQIHAEAPRLFRDVLSTLHITDYGLFGT